MEILIAEDELSIAQSLKKNLLSEGHHATVAKDGMRALELLSKIQFDVILLDWRMPKFSGYEVCKKLREDGIKTPVILITALNDISNKISALNVGADDYITKPFSFEEVIARINAVIRRFRESTNVLYFSNFSLDLISHKLTGDDQELKLSEKEFELLHFFLLNKGEVQTKDRLLAEVWKLDFVPTTNFLEATIKNLRKNLESFTGKKFIKTLYGEGYLFLED